MSVIAVSGLPGKGKNVFTTNIAIKHYKKTNNIFNKLIRKILRKNLVINNIYSTYPILLNKKKKIYSNIITINDLNNNYSFLPDSIIIIDEVQSFYDSDEYKNFPKNIAVFNQFHRHFDIKNIYYVSQHPSRIVKKLRNVMCEFYKIRNFIKFPFIPFGIMYYSIYYEFDDYGKWHHPKKEFKTYDVKNKFLIINVRKVFKSYNSKYLKILNSSKPLYNKGIFTSKNLNEMELKNIFRF